MENVPLLSDSPEMRQILSARSRRDLPAGFVEVVVQQEGSDDLEFIVHADALIGALVSARDRDAN